MKYIKKPIAIEAVQQDKEFTVKTLEGTMTGKPGDYLVTGVNGEQYPCNKEIFEKTYMKVESFKDRLIIEARDLKDKLSKLSAFIKDSDTYKELSVLDKTLLLTQKNAMKDYLFVLKERIKRL